MTEQTDSAYRAQVRTEVFTLLDDVLHEPAVTDRVTDFIIQREKVLQVLAEAAEAAVTAMANLAEYHPHYGKKSKEDPAAALRASRKAHDLLSATVQAWRRCTVPKNIAEFIISSREVAMLKILEAADPLEDFINDIYSPLIDSQELRKHLCNFATTLRDQKPKLWPTHTK